MFDAEAFAFGEQSHHLVEGYLALGFLYAERPGLAPQPELAPGVTVHHVGGHTNGLQVVRVRTRRGWVVLASDATHFYANLEQARPYPIVYNIGDMLEGFEKVRRLADSPDHIVPGHDPLVMTRYPAPNEALEDWIVRLDVPPA